MQRRVAVAAAVMAVPGPIAVLAAVIGNGLEWYNFMLYGVFAGVIAKLFFPVANPLASLLLSLGTFSVGFFMRPLGGTLLGMYSDRVGRKAALSLTILLMCVGTAMIALMPTYGQIGIAAPLLLVLARLLQGFSTGGEMGNATAFMREYAPPGRSGFYVS
jgi:MHS family proline/betaine transporter-like MFS transporter